MPKRIYSVTGHEGEKAFTRTTQTMKYRYAAVLVAPGVGIQEGAVSFSATASGADKSGRQYLQNCGPDYRNNHIVKVLPVTLIKGTED